MSTEITYSKWELTDAQLEEIGEVTPEIVRDLMVVCFANAQKEILADNPGLVTGAPTNADVNEMVLALLHSKVRELGASFDKPSKALLMDLMDELALVSASWGAPQEVIQHHLTLMSRIIARIPD